MRAIFAVLLLAFFAYGCAPSSQSGSGLSSGGGIASQTYYVPVPTPVMPKEQGVYYRVKKGQTLWRIANDNNIDLKYLMKINNLSGSSSVKENQLLFIPNFYNKKDISVYQPRERRGIKSEGSFVMPTKGHISVYYGDKKEQITNKGIDVIAPKGTVVCAAKTGIVSYVNEHMRGLGKVIIIDHQDGFITVYAHLSDFSVKEGARVRQGQEIAKVGNSGDTKEAMLHFEIRKNAKPVNPLNFINY